MNKTIVATALAGMALASPGAYAQWAVTDPGTYAAIAASTTLLAERLGAVQTGVAAAVNSSTAVLSTVAVTEAGKATLEAKKNAVAMKQMEAEAQYQVGDGCAAMAAADTPAAIINPGGGSSGGGRGSSGSLGGSKKRGGGTANIDEAGIRKVLDIAKGAAPPPAAEVQAAAAVKIMCGTFATGYRASNCTGAGFSAGVSSGLPDADIKASTLFDGPQPSTNSATPTSESAIRKHYTFEAGTVDGHAIEAYQRNLGTPIELRQLTKSELSSEAGRQFLSFKDSYDARISLAERPMKDIVKNRLATLDTKSYLYTLRAPGSTAMLPADDGKPFLPRYLAENVPKWETTGISTDELYNLEVLRRYSNAGWHLQVHNGMTPEAAAKEGLEMQAFQIVLLWRLIQSVETMSAVSGQATAAAIRTEMNPQLNALHAAASAR